MKELTKIEKKILESVSQPPKRLRDFLPFVLPVGIVVLLGFIHAGLLHY